MKIEPYPDFFKMLPQVDLPIDGVKGWLAQGDTFQIVFFEIQPKVTIPPHSHKAQWGILIEGALRLTIGDKVHELKPGDSYYIPEGVVHSGTAHTFTRAMDFFAEPHRYKTK
jgi:quercetin dioxygenase-like cupin family protein